jgi:hypothetical protein
MKELHAGSASHSRRCLKGGAAGVSPAFGTLLLERGFETDCVCFMVAAMAARQNKV